VRCTCRLAIAAILAAQLFAIAAVAQVQVHGLSVGASGSLGTTYGGGFGNSGGSDHSLGLDGSGSVAGYYYVPSFASFNFSPYYGRSQDNSTFGSIQDSSGYSGTINLFSGSHTPMGISFTQAWNSVGSFGFPGSSGLATSGNSRSFSLGGSILEPGLPSLTVVYTQGDSSSSVFGSSAGSEGSNHAISLRSAYQLDGFTLGAGYSRTVDDTTSSILTGGTPDISNTTIDTYTVGISHKLPLHGAIGGSASRSDYNFNGSGGVSNTGTTDNANVNASLRMGIFPVTITANYTDNLYGSTILQSVTNGTSVYESTITPESRSLLISANTSYILLRKIFLTGYIDHQDQYLDGQSYGVTQYGLSAHYNFAKRWDGLSVTVGVNDQANKSGNLGVGLVTNVHFGRRFGAWRVDANYNYDQNVQTLLVLYTISSMNYSANAYRRLPKGFNWSVSGGGGRSGFSQTPGNGSHAESVGSSVSWRGYSLGVNYGRSSGTSVVTPTGLQPSPGPIVSSSELVVYNARNFGAGFTATPITNLTVAVAYSDGSSTAVGLGTEQNRSQVMNGIASYRVRKLNFNAGYTSFRQSSVATGAGAVAVSPSRLNTYYFGISRWFKFF
jgi:hypothetical protein